MSRLPSSNRPSGVRNGPHGSRSGRFFGEKGYALPLVVLAIALFLVYAGESAARAVREARIARMKVNADLAYYAAEAGFNRARARLVGGGSQSEMEALNGLTETFIDTAGETGGRYLLTVIYVDDGSSEPYYDITSTGYYAEGTPYEAMRQIAGEVRVINASVTPRAVHTKYK